MSRLAAALDAWSAALGPSAVSIPASPRTAADGSQRRIPAVLSPSTTADVREVVRIAARFRTPVHPVSRGRNWGMGSALPPRDDTVVVDLARLDRIREINAGGLHAVLEPGVTQGALHRQLRGTGLVFNVTGSSADSSILGNALERGVGYFASRADSLTALEVVTGTGEILRTGFGAIEGARTAHLYRHGIGPSLDGLFAQSGFGIVTAAGFGLMRAWERPAAFTLRLRDEARLADLVDRFASLREDGVIRSVVHLADAVRGRITLAPLLAAQLPDHEQDRVDSLLHHFGYDGWGAVSGMGGPADVSRACARVLARRLSEFGRFQVFTPRTFRVAGRILSALGRAGLARRHHCLLQAVRPLAGLAWGEPTDETLGGVFWPVPGEQARWRGKDPDSSTAGLMYILPILPARGRVAVPAANHARAFLRSRGFEAAITLNLLDERSLEAVISIDFSRAEPGRAETARQAMNELEEWFLRAGFPPYRLGIDSASPLASVSPETRRVLAGLKNTFDPAGIISPGRYGLDAS
ncbi:MAG: FAD-binding oxidoreductase [Kiritimatiellia bacterium]